MPWGSSSTMPFCRTHLAWPELMNWSMMHWAVLWKSPNWASHRTSALGLAMAKPNSKPADGWGWEQSRFSDTQSDVREHFEETLACFRRHLALRIQTESCCRRCKEPDWGRCGSSGCRSSYRRSGRAERGVDGCEAKQTKKPWILLHIPVKVLLSYNVLEIPWHNASSHGCRRRGGINIKKKTVEEKTVFLFVYLKVPLSASCPLRRTWIPSFSREPKAIYSPRAQSHTRWLTMFPRPFRIRLKPKTRTWSRNTDCVYMHS